MRTTPDPMKCLLQPRSVAVVGASADASRIGGRPIALMLRAGFAGAIYPVNPNRDEVQGLRAYAGIGDLPEVPDVAIIAVPAALAVDAVEALGAQGVGAAVVLTAGFAEAGGGEEGRMRQDEMLARARKHGMRLLGPNCLGLFNARIGWYATFSTAFDGGWPEPGRVAIVSQSGAFGSNLVCLARDRGIGTPVMVTTGNEADITVGEVIQHYVDDPDTDVIAAYAEGISQPGKFVAALEAARRARKPIVMLKVGRSAAGSRAAQSHTASIAGDDAVFDALLQEHGVVRARSIEHLLDVAYTATRGIFPVPNSLGVVTISGGVGAMISDAADELGIPMPPMPPDAERRLLQLVPYASPANPVDCTAQALNDPSLVRRFTEEMLTAGGYASVLAFFAQMADVPSIADRLLADMGALQQAHPDRLFVLAANMSKERTRAYERQGILVFEDPTRAAQAIAAMGTFGQGFAAPQRQPASAGPLPFDLPHGPVSEAVAKRLLSDAGIATPPERSCATAQEAVEAARALGFPVVMKILSPDIAHKTEIGGVLLDTRTEDAVRDGFGLLMQRGRDAAPGARLDGVLVARQMTGGLECIAGIQHDPVFGPVALFGLGGIFVEALRDVVLKRCPFGVEEAQEMVYSIRGAQVLRGMRNRPAADVPALARMLSALSHFAWRAGPALRSVDLNPVLVLPEGQGAYALDALIELQDEQGTIA